MDRDAIAVLAMQGMLAHAQPYKPSETWKRDNPGKTWHDCLAKEAYTIAAAMIRARDVDQKARERALRSSIEIQVQS